MGVHRGAKRAFAPRLEIGIKNQIFLEKAEVGILNSDELIWFLQWQVFAGMKLTLHKSQVHSYSVMQCAHVPPPLPAEAACESRERIVLLLVFIS